MILMSQLKRSKNHKLSNVYLSKMVSLDVIKRYTYHKNFNWYYYNDILRYEILRHFLN